MAKYVSGQKLVQHKVKALQREMDALRQAAPVYDVDQRATYGSGLAALREAYSNGKAGLQPLFVQEDGSPIVRPLTFEETIDAIVNAYESGNRILLNNWNDSCTGIAYKANTSKFKVVPASKELILLGDKFKSPYVSVDYAAQEGTELDRTNGKYRVPLAKSEVLKNSGWRESVTDNALLKAFRDIVFAELKKNGRLEGMGFYPRENITADHLRALAVFDIDIDSSAYDRYGLNDDARFVRVSPKSV